MVNSYIPNVIVASTYQRIKFQNHTLPLSLQKCVEITMDTVGHCPFGAYRGPWATALLPGRTGLQRPIPRWPVHHSIDKKISFITSLEIFLPIFDSGIADECYRSHRALHTRQRTVTPTCILQRTATFGITSLSMYAHRRCRIPFSNRGNVDRCQGYKVGKR